MSTNYVVIVLRPDTFSGDGVRPDVLGIYPDTDTADRAIDMYVETGRALEREAVWCVPVSDDDVLGSVLHHQTYGYADPLGGCSMWVNDRGQSYVAALFNGQFTVVPAEDVTVSAVR